MGTVLTIDDSLWPLVIYRLQGVMTDAQCQELMERTNAFLARPERYVCVADLSGAGIAPTEQRRVLADWIRGLQPVIRERVQAHVTLITSAPIRLVVSAIFHLRPLPVPHITAAHMDAALPFVLAQLRDAGRQDEADLIQLRLDARHVNAG